MTGKAWLGHRQGQARIDLGALEALDTAGAWLLCHIRDGLAERGWQVELAHADPTRSALLAEIQRLKSQPATPPRINPLVRLLARLGRSTVSACNEASRLLSFYGETIVTMLPASWFAPLLRANARSPSGHSISSRHGDSC